MLKDTKIYLTGISPQPVRTLGTTNIKINNLDFEFHVTPDNFSIPYHGILGINILISGKITFR